MNLQKALLAFVKVISDEAERNPDFAQRMAAALESSSSEPGDTKRPPPRAAAAADRRPRNRRPPAVLDPVEVAKEGEQILRNRLSRLTLEQLRDIVADQGMDPGKLVMKWKSTDRIIDRIVEISLPRAQKGNAFRSD